MKICKNCGRQTDDDKVRCPYCGNVFEGDMDLVLRRMKSDLQNCKNGYAAAAQPVAQAQPVAPAQAQPAVPAASAQESSWQKERLEMMTSLAEMRGEVRALHGELDRLQSGRAAYPQPIVLQQPSAAGDASAQPAAYAPAPAAQAAQPQYVSAPQYVAAPGVMYVPPQVAAVQPGNETKSELKKVRSSNRIVIAILCIALIAVSVAMFFRPWVTFLIGAEEYSFRGFDAVNFLLGNGAGSNFDIYLHQLISADALWMGNYLATPVRYVVYYGIVVYGALLVLTFPILFSLGGRFIGKGWHSAFAWLPFIVALILFGLFFWISGFSSMTMSFLIGAAANLVRVIFIAFYSRKVDWKIVEKPVLNTPKPKLPEKAKKK